MRLFFSLSLLFLFSVQVHSQVVSPDSTMVVYVDSLQRWVEKTMDNDGRLFSEICFSDSLLTIKDGYERYFYSAGKTKNLAYYSNGKLEGDVFSYYSDGRIIRKDVFNQGMFIEGTCFAANGMKVPHTEYKKDAVYSGGVQGLYTIVSANSLHVELPEGISGDVQVKIYINKKGKIVERKIIKHLHPLADAESLRISEHLGRFEPAERDGDTVPDFYILTLKF
ncbi:MAG: hypothetical protein MJ198_04140 [Bacteroidales bacterium]|nr:hypothetical protein [Bacteroidales bacterium]